ncbi:MAG: hypothetical protein J3K34DRAFT_60593 [Monoraphidium minutum]|nr:MAG: hypothetical protein J3K34DRAFT_60593 [Monoraphidium minutum]
MMYTAPLLLINRAADTSRDWLATLRRRPHRRPASTPAAAREPCRAPHTPPQAAPTSAKRFGPRPPPPPSSLEQPLPRHAPPNAHSANQAAPSAPRYPLPTCKPLMHACLRACRPLPRAAAPGRPVPCAQRIALRTTIRVPGPGRLLSPGSPHPARAQDPCLARRHYTCSGVVTSCARLSADADAPMRTPK